MAAESKAVHSRCKILSTVDETVAWRKAHARSRVGFVPTMGALHEGHMALIRRARAECDKVIVSIFVNPLQFAPHEDLSRYPRPLAKDIQMCETAAVDAIFHPGVEALYGHTAHNATTTVVPAQALTSTLEGAFRLGHFTGVATVVAKLFNIVSPNFAYFGEKDYQQLQVILAMVKELNVQVEIVPVPTVREPDGLALSSRNVYLNEEQRKIAPRLNATLSRVRDLIEAGTPSQTAVQQGRDELAKLPGITLQYLEVRQGQTLQPLETDQKPYVLLIAAKLGEVRLIDNLIVR